MARKALVFLAPGAEEMEFTITVDVLRRGGVEVTAGSLSGTHPVKCSRGVVIVPDESIESVSSKTYDAIILPGGLAGSEALCKSRDVASMLWEQERSGRIIAAICAGTSALKEHGICRGKMLTSYPSIAPVMSVDYNYKTDDVVVDGNLITSRGPGTAFQFALAVLRALTDDSVVDKVADGMIYTYK